MNAPMIASTTANIVATFDAAARDDTATATGVDTAGDVENGSFFCCNANPDPCCAYLHCDGSMTPMCDQELACESDGGSWNAIDELLSDGGRIEPGCSPSPEAGPSDAASDAHD
jgi:hypothetical protein